MADSPVLRGGHLIEIDHGGLGAIVLKLVRPGGNIKNLIGFEHAGPWIGGIGAHTR